jgi:signal transduction histidine kinase/CheY-like chemotaxis protein
LSYLLLGLLSTRLQVANLVVTVIPFLPEGVALACLLRIGAGVLPGIFIGQFALAHINDSGMPVALGLATGNMLAGALGLWLLRWFRFDFRLERFRDMLLLLGVSMLACQPLSASVGHVTLWLDGKIQADAIGFSWFQWWQSNVTAQLFLTPLLLRIWINPLGIFRCGLRCIGISCGFATALAMLAFLKLPWLSEYQGDIQWLILPVVAISAALLGIDIALTQVLWIVVLVHAGLVLGVSNLNLTDLSQAMTHVNFLLATSSLCACYVGVINSELVAACTRADLASAYRTRFLASMSHEIRTPLNGMLGLVQLLQRSGIHGKERNHIEEIGRAGRSLLSLLNNILDLSKLEAGELRLQNTWFRLDDLLEDTASVCLASVESKGLEFWIGCAPGVPERCFGDAVRLQQILTNLIGNAAKFTSTGSIRILVTALDTAEATLCLEVKDTGIGMDEHSLAHIFEPYHQGDSSISNRFGGTGLGLTLACEIVEQMGGTLKVFSTFGEGSRFQIHIPSGCEMPPDPQVLGTLWVDLPESCLQECIVLSAMRLGWMPAPAQEADIILSAIGGTGKIQFGLLEDTIPGKVVLPNPFTPLRLSLALQEAQSGPTEFLIPVVRPVLAGRRILLVEDEPINRLVARQILEQAGAEIVEVSDGFQAIELLNREQFSAILMDLHMPVMGGIEATRRIRAGHGQKPCILALTAGSTEEERKGCERAGMDGFLTKPFEAELLIQTLSEFS